jgi:P-type conjugative transfer protein TrbJ
MINPALAGGGVVDATELTQIANNLELIGIAELEGQNLAINTDILSQEIQQLATQINTYQAILQNLEQLPDTYLSEAMEPVQKLHQLMSEARTIAASGRQLDDFLRSDLITDPLFDGKVLSDARLSERYDEWLDIWDSSLEAGLKQVGLTFEDIETEAQLIDQISGRFSGIDGNLKALQVSNELSSSVARQLVDLRALTATQAQQNTAAWSRVLADLDRKESAQRETDVEIHESIEAYEETGEQRTVNEILGLGE